MKIFGFDGLSWDGALGTTIGISLSHNFGFLGFWCLTILVSHNFAVSQFWCFTILVWTSHLGCSSLSFLFDQARKLDPEWLLTYWYYSLTGATSWDSRLRSQMVSAPLFGMAEKEEC